MRTTLACVGWPCNAPSLRADGVLALDLAVAAAVTLARALVRAASLDAAELAGPTRVGALAFDHALHLVALDAHKALVTVRQRVHDVALAPSRLARHSKRRGGCVACGSNP